MVHFLKFRILELQSTHSFFSFQGTSKYSVLVLLSIYTLFSALIFHSRQDSRAVLVFSIAPSLHDCNKSAQIITE